MNSALREPLIIPLIHVIHVHNTVFYVHLRVNVLNVEITLIYI